MFLFQKGMTQLNIPAQRVLRLQRSMVDIDVALPGLQAQPAEAFICAYAGERGARVAIALLARQDHLFSFYMNDEGDVPPQEAGHLLNEAIAFVESMGFMMVDVDFQLLDPLQRVALWEEIPLRSGVHPVPEVEAEEVEAEEAEAEEAEAEEVEAEEVEAEEAEAEEAEAEEAEAEEAEAEEAEAEEAEAEEAEAEEAAFTAVEHETEGLIPSPVLPSSPLSPEEEHRQALERLGRLLASL